MANSTMNCNSYQSQAIYRMPSVFLMQMLLVLASLMLINPSHAFGDANTINKLIKKDTTETTSTAEVDAYHRDTPFGTAKGIDNAIKKEDINLLLAYLDPKFVKKKLATEDAKVLFFKQLSTLLNRHATLDAKPSLSKEPNGKVDDGLSEKFDYMGFLTIKNEPQILLERIEVNKKPRWVLTSEFSAQVGTYYQSLQPVLVDRWMPSTLDKRIFGISLTHLLASVMLAGVAFSLGAFLSTLSLLFLKLIFRVMKKRLFSLKPIYVPLAIIFATSCYQDLLTLFGVERPTQALTLPVVNVLGILSVSWLIYRMVDAVASQFEQTDYKQRLKGNLSGLYLLKGIAKAGVIVVTFLLVLSSFGVDVSSGVALLGLGGLALALGAQKTVENFVGSIVVVADKPIDIGDFCRFGNIEGTVEDIGIRSTRIRTLARTLVTIPNGEFSSIQIENYSKRDRFLFNHCFAFGLHTSKAKLETVLDDMRSLLANRDDLYQPDNRVRLRYTERDCFKIEVVCYVLATDINGFLAVQESLLLEFIEMIDGSNVDLALPVQLINTDKT